MLLLATREKVAQHVLQAAPLVADHQLCVLQATADEVLQEALPTVHVLLHPLSYSQNLSESLLIHADRHQHCDVPNLAVSAPLQPDAVQVPYG